MPLRKITVRDGVPEIPAVKSGSAPEIFKASSQMTDAMPSFGFQ